MLLDGTWNEDEEDRPSSNIVYLRERLFWGLQSRLRRQAQADRKAYDGLPESIRKKGVNGFIFDGFEYLAYYDRGVGTGAYLDVIKGGLTGLGLDDNIREAYRFLSTWFRPGDEIFVFGFSRGAFTARSLCGYIQASGLLRPQFCTTLNEQRAWDFYRTPPGQRAAGEWLHFRSPEVPGGEPLVYDESYTRVRILGVFDTVGALGIPVEGFRRINRANYEFHDPEANSIVDIRLHAVAIDEPRKPFAPTLWTKPKFKKISDRRSPTEQVWFSGAHADVGGGYVQWNREGQWGLSDLPLTWMLQRVRHHVINTAELSLVPSTFTSSVPRDYRAPIPFYQEDLLTTDPPFDPLTPPVEADLRKLSMVITQKIKDLATSTQHVPWAALSEVRPNIRPINQFPLPDQPGDEQQGRVPYADPIGEAVHVSALTRFRDPNSTAVDRGKLAGAIRAVKGVFVSNETLYRPRNLVNIIPYVAATYLDRHKLDARRDKGWGKCVLEIYSWKHIRVVDWDGRVLDPTSEADVVSAINLLPNPMDVGLTDAPPAGMALFKLPDTVIARRHQRSLDDAAKRPPTGSRPSA